MNVVGEFVGEEKCGKTIGLFAAADGVQLILHARGQIAVFVDLREVAAVVFNAALQHAILLGQLHGPGRRIVDRSLGPSKTAIQEHIGIFQFLRSVDDRQIIIGGDGLRLFGSEGFSGTRATAVFGALEDLDLALGELMLDLGALDGLVASEGNKAVL